MTDHIASAREAAAYIRAEADFNRSMVDGRRSHGYSATTPEYVARRLHLAAERDRWADAIEALAAENARLGDALDGFWKISFSPCQDPACYRPTLIMMQTAYKVRHPSEIPANVTPPSNREPAETVGNLDCVGDSSPGRFESCTSSESEKSAPQRVLMPELREYTHPVMRDDDAELLAVRQVPTPFNNPDLA